MRAPDPEPLTTAILVVYPTALKAASVLREQARVAGCLLGHGVTTFPQLTDALARDLGVPARVLPPEMAAVVLARALAGAQLPEALRLPRRGLLRALLDLIGELKAACLDPEALGAIAEALPAGADAERLIHIGRVYAAYEAALARLGMLDRPGRAWRVCEALAAAEAAGRPPRVLAGVRRIVFAEIYDYSLQQFLIATSLIRLVGDAELVAFAHPENVDATRFLDRTWNRFVADAGIADQVLPSFVVRSGRQGNLSAALRGVFAADRPAPVAPDGTIRLLEAPSRYREVEAALGEVRRRLDDGLAPERCALIARDLGPYGELIEDVARRYGVPVHFRRGTPLLGCGVVKTTMHVLRAAAEGLPRRRLEALLDSDYLRAGPPELTRVLRRTGFVAEHARPLAECLAHGPEVPPAASRDRLLAVVGVVRDLDRPRTVAGHARALRSTLARLGVRPVRTEGLPAATIRRDGQAWAGFEDTLITLGGIAGAVGIGRIPLAEFVPLLLAALETRQLEEQTTAVGSVRALGVLDARGLDFDIVYLLGLDDGTFPAPRSESPLLPDALRREINRLGPALLRRRLGARAEGVPLAGMLRTAREASLEDPFLFFLALSMAERELVLSWPTVDERGNPTVVSPFVDEVRAGIAGDLPHRTLDPTELIPPVEECGEPAELVARSALERWGRAPDAGPDRVGPVLCARLPDGAARLAAIDARALVEERRARYFLTADAAAKEVLADAWVGRVAGDPLLAARLDAMRWSPSRLEILGGCGFRFFTARILGVDEDDEPELEVAAAERGRLMHHVLSEFFAAVPVLPVDLEAARALGRTFMEGGRERMASIVAAKDPYLFALTWGSLGTALDELIVREHDEQREQAAAGVTVERWLERTLDFTLEDAEGGTLQLTGRPDRVEIHRLGTEAVLLRVLDYKVSRDPTRFGARLDPEKDLGRTSFQIPVYLLGALAHDLPGVGPGTLYDGGLVAVLAGDRGRVVRPIARALLAPEAVTADGTPTLPARIRRLVGAVRAGRFDVAPDPCDPYCRYRSVCRYQPPPLEDDTRDG